MKQIVVKTEKEDHYDVFERLVAKGGLRYEPIYKKRFDEWTEQCLAYVSGVAKRDDLRVCTTVVIHPKRRDLISRSFKVKDKFFSYLDVCPLNGTFMIVEDEEHREAMHPDVFLARSLGCDAKVLVNKHGSTIALAKGSTVTGLTIMEKRSGKDRVKRAEAQRKKNLKSDQGERSRA
ncbi:MAG: hypothetical protein Q8K86_11655 [Candidatus Nanopelagicaceae bacterium]|nr:hypothetical protein [Candidatus Nanopelagicaceae bacterium]